MIYKSLQMHDIAERCRNIAHKDKDVPVLLLGESGVGKTMLADYIHYQTPQRCSEPFVEPVLSRDDNLLDSELFGYVKGAFTGADTNRIGAFALAKGGTVFMDEIGDLSPHGQFKLLKTVDERWYSPMGSCERINTDTRIIAATNKSLTDLQAGTYFRNDLYHRLSGETIVIPPLRKRPEDIVPLAEYFINGWNEQHHTSYVLGNDDKALLVGYSFPGNVRELNNIVCHTARSSETDFNTDELNRTLSQRKTVIVPKSVFERTFSSQSKFLSLKEAQQEMERDRIKKALIITNYNYSHASKLLGIDRVTLRKKINIYKLSNPRDDLLSRSG
ncbi:MAG: sigma 54-interacting transcriptional regulator [Planctomycetota bacterium]